MRFSDIGNRQVGRRECWPKIIDRQREEKRMKAALNDVQSGKFATGLD